MKFHHILPFFVAVIVYVAVGGFILQGLEYPNESELQANFVQELKQFNKRIGECLSSEELANFIEQVMNAQRSGLLTVQYNTSSVAAAFRKQWSFSASILTSVKLAITGGDISQPLTTGGQVFGVVYAIFGTLLLLIVIHLFASAVFSSFRGPKMRPRHSGRIFRRLLVVLISGLLLFFIGPAVAFALIENWSYSQSFFFTYFQLITSGFQLPTHRPGVSSATSSWWYHLLIAFWRLSGFCWLGTCIALFRAFVSRVYHQRQKIKRELNKMAEAELAKRTSIYQLNADEKGSNYGSNSNGLTTKALSYERSITSLDYPSTSTSSNRSQKLKPFKSSRYGVKDGHRFRDDRFDMDQPPIRLKTHYQLNNL